MFFAQMATASPAPEAAESFSDIVSSITGDMGHIVPEIMLSIGVILVLMMDLFGAREKTRQMGYVTLGVLAATLTAVLMGCVPTGSQSVFRGMLVADSFGYFFQVLLLLGSIICIPMVRMHRAFNGMRMGEFYALLLGSIVGMFLMVRSANLLMVYLGIEFASLTCYLLTAYIKSDQKAAEGGLKYVIYGSVSSGMMIYGMSLIYGLTGTLDVAGVANGLIVAQTVDTTLVIAGLLAFAGFAYKISAFPMHFWCPDVYEGAPVPFTAFLSVISKAAGFAVFIRFLWAYTAEGSYELTLPGDATLAINWPIIIGVIAAITMTLGNLSALFQTNLKRMLAYSSIAHAGYLLMGAAALFPASAHDPAGWQPIAFYLLVYLFMNLGAFLVVTIVANQGGGEEVDDYRGMLTRNKLLAVALMFFFLSLIGLPPTAGFIGKLQLLQVTLENGLVWLAVIAGINTAISVYYYWRVVKVMMIDKAREADAPVVLESPVRAFVCALLAPILILGVFFDKTLSFILDLTL